MHKALRATGHFHNKTDKQVEGAIGYHLGKLRKVRIYSSQVGELNGTCGARKVGRNAKSNANFWGAITRMGKKMISRLESRSTK